MYLVDTNVISAGAPVGPDTHRPIAAWMRANSAHLYLPTVVVTELEAGIAKLRRKGVKRRADSLETWLVGLLHLHAARVLPFDLAAARLAGTLVDLARGKGHEPEFADVAIAATAATRGLTVLTRNVRHFAPLGVAFLDPFRTLPSSESH